MSTAAGPVPIAAKPSASVSSRNSPSYTGSTGNKFRIFNPQVEFIGLSTSSTLGAIVETVGSINIGTPVIMINGVPQSAYTIANGLITFTTAPSAAAVLTWTGCFGFLCRFDDDSVDFDQFMSSLWRLESLKFRSVRAQ